MPASYPSSSKTFTTKSDGAGNTILAAYVNDLQLEVTAIEQDLIAGLPVARGGTGLTTLAANRIPYGNGTSALQSAATLTFDGTTFTAPATTITQPLTISGAAAGQIVFPAAQNASTNANTLDDYEETTWTPVIGGSGGTSGQAYSTQVGHAIKVGKQVTAWFRVQLSTLGTITTDVQIQGLPFTSENTTNLSASVTIGRWSNLTTALVQLSGVMEPNTTAITLWASGSAVTAVSKLAQADLAATSYLEGTITYKATA